MFLAILPLNTGIATLRKFVMIIVSNSRPPCLTLSYKNDAQE